MKNLEKRTSIRKYAQREVSNELLHRLLQEAERTQTMGNLQLYSVIITRSEEQPTDGNGRSRSAYLLRRFPTHFALGGGTESTAGLRQLPVVYQCGHGCPTLLPDIL